MGEYMSRSWGIELGNNIIVDLIGQQLVQQPFMAVGADYTSHSITSKMEGLATFFYTARSVKAAQSIDGITQTELVMTSSDSWAETNLQGIMNQEQPAYDDNDQQGPVTLMVLGQNASTQARVAVVGDADFAADGSFTAYGNSDLVLNTIDWAVGQEDLIALTAKSTTSRTFTLTPTTYTVGLLFLLSVIVVPALALVLGVVAFIYRRRRG